MRNWKTFSENHSYDQFWVDNEPAFHTYDCGANIEIEVNEELKDLPMETRLRSESEDDDDPDSDSDSESEIEPEPDSELEPEPEPEPELDPEPDSELDPSDANAIDDHDDGNGGQRDSTGSRDEALTEGNPAGPENDHDIYQEHLYSDGLEHLRTELEKKYNIDNIDQISYVRHLSWMIPEDLLPARGIATGALTLPPSEAIQRGYIAARQQRLLRSLSGEQTPDQPSLTMPFAREGHRIRAAMSQDQVAFRMEQVVTIRPSKLERGHRHFFSVLHPIFQLMRFFLKEKRAYTTVLRSFLPSVFPTILCSFAKLFELGLAEMHRRFLARAEKGLDL
ncbi:hypothetical protein BFJ68_g18232, partial [Fusarium oxysporum]